MVCAGNVVGYGPDPSGAIRILRERGIPTVMGNHDAAVVGWRDTDDMIDTAREDTERHRRELGKDELDWLRALPYVYDNDGFAVAHANFANPHFILTVHDSPYDGYAKVEWAEPAGSRGRSLFYRKDIGCKPPTPRA